MGTPFGLRGRLMCAAVLGALTAAPYAVLAAPANVEAAAVAAAPSPAHLAAVADMLDAMGLPELALAPLQQVPGNGAPVSEARARFIAQIDRPTLLRRFAAAFAGQVTEAQARAVAAEFRTPEGRAVLRTLNDASAVSLTGADMRRANAFGSGLAGKTYLAMQEVLGRRHGEIMYAWFRDYYVELIPNARRAIVDARAARLAADPRAEPVLFSPARSGVPHIDAIVAAIASAAFDMDHQTWELDRALDALKLQPYLAPSALADAAQRAQGLVALDQADRHVETYIAAIDASLKKLGADLAAIETPNKEEYSRAFAASVEKELGAAVRLGEGQRHLLGIVRRIVLFANTHTVTFQAAQGQLVFQNDAERAAYDALLTEWDSAVRQARALALALKQPTPVPPTTTTQP